MANTLVGLSNEIKDSIYEHLEDLDDAWHLSQTCKVFQAQLRIIQKKVIVRKFKAPKLSAGNCD